MKRLFMVLAVAAIAVTASAQVNFNIRGGVGLSNLTGDGSPDCGFAYKIGAGIEVPIASGFYFQPSLYFEGLSFKKEVNVTSAASVKTTSHPLYLQLPLDIAYKVAVDNSSNIAFKVGPYLGFGVGGKQRYTANVITTKYDYFDDGVAKSFDAGIDFGIDYEFAGNWVVGINGQYGFTDVSDVDNVSNHNLDAFLTLGYRF